jgi:uncharacterized protein (DUF1499 family)
LILLERVVELRFKCLVLLVATLLGACAEPAPSGTAPAVDPGIAGLLCARSGNCVSSRGNDAVSPLIYTGTPAQAMALLQATLKTFPEATIVRSEALAMVVIFTTRVGFRDQVDFQIDEVAQRIHFRSRSLVGLYDFGKNRSRMQAFRARFEQQARQ